jgi:hypothetical protein
MPDRSKTSKSAVRNGIDFWHCPAHHFRPLAFDPDWYDGPDSNAMTEH